jgi:hypothetical protein
MTRRVSNAVAVLLAVSLSLSAPSAYAANRGRDINPGVGSRIVQIIKKFAKKFLIISSDEDTEWKAGPPIP